DVSLYNLGTSWAQAKKLVYILLILNIFIWCPEGDLNPHSPCGPADFKSAASADFAIRALRLSYLKYPAKKKRPGRQEGRARLAGTALVAISESNAACGTRSRLRAGNIRRSNCLPRRSSIQ